MTISINEGNVRKYIQEICLRSPRYAGTEGEKKVCDYIVSEGKKITGNVELEEFEYIHYEPYSSDLRILEPVENTLNNFPLFYAASGEAEGEVVYAGSGTKEEFEFLCEQNMDPAGKVVLVSSTVTFEVYPLAQLYGAIAVVIISDAPNNLYRAGTATSNRKAGKIPGVIVPLSEGRRLLTLIGTGRLKLRVFTDGCFSKKTSNNVIMTIPGGISSQEQVILASHYDSFNLGNHAWDNASGCAAVLELMRVFDKISSDRTIKAVFFGIEELGPCWGSFSYVNRHAEDLPNVKAVITFDAMGTPTSLNFELTTTKEIRPFASSIVETLGYEMNSDREPGPWSDHLPFQKERVPAVWLLEDSLSVFYHTAKDDPHTLDYDKLKKLADINGEIVYSLANAKKLDF